MSRAVSALAVCVVLALGGCGGGDESASTASSSETTTAATAQAEDKSTTAPQEQQKTKLTNKASSPQDKGSKQQTNAPKKHLHLVRIPPISSAPVAGSKAPAPGVKTAPGADNSVQEYGVEAGESQRTEAAIALQAYLNARAREDWPGACALLAKRPKEQLERVQEAAAKQGTELNGCAGAMALLKEGEGQLQGQARISEVLSFRGGGDISGNPSYLLYSAPPSNTLYSMPMYLQGTWKAGLVRAAELPLG